MSGREIGNMFLHMGGAALMSVLALWNPWMLVPDFFVIGFLREQAQHRDEGFFGWITGHRLWEAFHWPIGALVAVSLWELIT